MTQRMHQAAGLQYFSPSAEQIRYGATNLHTFGPKNQAEFAADVIRFTRRFEAICREASDSAHQANMLRAELVMLRQQLNETLAAGGASPSAPPAGPSAGGGD